MHVRFYGSRNLESNGSRKLFQCKARLRAKRVVIEGLRSGGGVF